MQKVKLLAAAKNMQDGSVQVVFFTNKQNALDHLDRTEEELKAGTPYDDGILEEVTLELTDEGVLLNKPVLDLDCI